MAEEKFTEQFQAHSVLELEEDLREYSDPVSLSDRVQQLASQAFHEVDTARRYVLAVTLLAGKIRGVDIERDNVKALILLQKMVDSNQTFMAYGALQNLFEGVEEEYLDFARKILDALVDLDSPKALFELAVDLEGNNSSLGHVVMHKAAKLGSADAQCWMGCMIQRKKSQHNLKLAYEFFQQAAASGHADALAHLGDFYYEGSLDSIQVDHAKAFDLYCQSNQAGSAEGAFRLSRCFTDGNGTEKSPEMARQLMQYAAEHGLIDAQVQSAKVLLLRGDPVKAQKYLKMANRQDEELTKQYCQAIQLDYEHLIAEIKSNVSKGRQAENVRARKSTPKNQQSKLHGATAASKKKKAKARPHAQKSKKESKPELSPEQQQKLEKQAAEAARRAARQVEIEEQRILKQQEEERAAREQMQQALAQEKARKKALKIAEYERRQREAELQRKQSVKNNVDQHKPTSSRKSSKVSPEKNRAELFPVGGKSAFADLIAKQKQKEYKAADDWSALLKPKKKKKGKRGQKASRDDVHNTATKYAKTLGRMLDFRGHYLNSEGETQIVFDRALQYRLLHLCVYLTEQQAGDCYRVLRNRLFHQHYLIDNAELQCFLGKIVRGGQFNYKDVIRVEQQSFYTDIVEKNQAPKRSQCIKLIKQELACLASFSKALDTDNFKAYETYLDAARMSLCILGDLWAQIRGVVDLDNIDDEDVKELAHNLVLCNEAIRKVEGHDVDTKQEDELVRLGLGYHAQRTNDVAVKRLASCLNGSSKNIDATRCFGFEKPSEKFNGVARSCNSHCGCAQTKV